MRLLPEPERYVEKGHWALAEMFWAGVQRGIAMIVKGL